MKYVFYLQNGIAADTLPEGYKYFYVAERLEASSAHSRYFFTGINVGYDPGYINQLAIISIIVACVHASAFLLCHIRTSNLGDTKYSRECV